MVNFTVDDLLTSAQHLLLFKMATFSHNHLHQQRTDATQDTYYQYLPAHLVKSDLLVAVLMMVMVSGSWCHLVQVYLYSVFICGCIHDGLHIDQHAISVTPCTCSRFLIQCMPVIYKRPHACEFEYLDIDYYV